MYISDTRTRRGDEIALRVFADTFKLVVCVVLQAEERLQVCLNPKHQTPDHL
jgi:hypothetical protein